MCEFSSKFTIKTAERRQRRCSGVFIVNFKLSNTLALKRFHILFWCFYCWLWRNNWRLGKCFGYPALDPRPLALGSHKIFNQLNLFLFKVESWSCAHYFRWFTGYLNHVDSLMSHVATCFKGTALLLNVHLSCFMDFILCLTDKYMLKVTNKKLD